MYGLFSRKSAEEKIQKVVKKDAKTAEILDKKISEIRQDPYKFKPLRVPMHGYRRVHIGKSYVLTYSIDEQNKIVIIEDYDHHDNVYRKK
ncbi:TPA: type II toxin-antitoxin system mRNA interferase toxin, RelE/StbE family [archaeon]|nr:type II toxin-antitoxin system mRNA interferase toxin, RelE/StbE family [Candidatus Naiadarchaeales archaeon SRR2090159.bin1288]